MRVQPHLARRTFVIDLGRGAFALAILGLAGCAPAQATPRPSVTASAVPSHAGGKSPSATASAPAASAPPAASGSGWSRVNLGFVSAYVLVRGGEAAIVDSGVAGSAEAIADSLRAAGVDWADVGHLVLTHNHGDHAGSAAAILEQAPDALGYAGAEDIAGISVPRSLIPVQDGDAVFGLRVVTTPGHTPGSICILDEAAGVLVAGDALRTDGGRPALPSAQFTADMDQARASVAKLGKLSFGTLLVGHGEPLDGGASAMVAALAAGD